MIETDAEVPKMPTTFGAYVTADHLIKNNNGEGGDEIPHDTVAAVLLDRGTGRLDVYPKASKSTEHTVEAFQHFAGAKNKVASS